MKTNFWEQFKKKTNDKKKKFQEKGVKHIKKKLPFENARPICGVDLPSKWIQTICKTPLIFFLNEASKFCFKTNFTNKFYEKIF